MKYFCTLFLLLAVSSYCHASATQQKPPLSDLKSFDTIEKLMPFDPRETYPERDYLHSLRDELAKAPVEKRAGLLDKLAQQTKWGTHQRFISYYVCAWHHINYNRTRDYLIHCAFWWEWKIDLESAPPFSFQDVSVDLLYALYERNHDFQILHDILTTASDAGTAELIVGLTEDATEKHPRGVLHVAEMSKKGRILACQLLHLPPSDRDHPLHILYGTESALKTFRVYVTRVASDPKDPLCLLAKGLLKKRARRCQ